MALPNDVKEYPTSTEAVELGLTPGSETPSDKDSDAEAVARLGVTPTLPRTLNKLIGLIGLNTSVVIPWPSYVLISVLNLANGGTAGLMIDTLIAAFFMGPVYISLAEKLRKYPTAGGQYHWVAALAPPSCRRYLSFLCCGILTFTWLSYLTTAAWLFGMDIQAIVLIYTGEYHLKYTFIAAACLQVFAFAVNITWGKHMNFPETAVVVVHVVAFFLLVGILGFGAGTGSVTPDFSFFSSTGWSPGFGAVLGIMYCTGTFSGFDSVSHLVEDTVDASRQVPKSLLWTTGVNMASCVPCGVLIVLCAGNLNELFTEPLGASGHPLGAVVQLFYNAARGNKPLASAVFGMILPILVMASINTTAAASRMIFSFIRDDRNPFVHRVMRKELTEQRVPLVSITFTAIAPLLILWINFVSSVAFQALVSQVTMSLATTYIMAIGCSLYSRWYQPDKLGRNWEGIFHLGQYYGTIIDSVSLVFLAFVWVLAWFPTTTPVNAQTLNYAPIIDVGLAILFTLYYLLYAKNHYHNPAPEDEFSH